MFDRAKFWRYARYAILTVALLAAGFTLYLDFRVRSEFEGRRFALPARIYARPLELHVGVRVPLQEIEAELRELGYRIGVRAEPGWYERRGDSLEISVRPFVFWDGPQPARRFTAVFRNTQIFFPKGPEGKKGTLPRPEPFAHRG